MTLLTQADSNTHTSRRNQVIASLIDDGAILVIPTDGTAMKLQGRCGIRHGDPVAISWRPDRYGYLSAHMSHRGVRSNIMLHRLVWIYVHGIPEPGLMIDHINRIRTDNRISNMRLADPKLNVNNSDRALGSKHHWAKLSDADVLRIRELYLQGIQSIALSREYAVNQSTIVEIVRRRAWRHI